jgi:3-hydroxyacyl-CoA dehydrogenase / enoyl-CoA hydratase / 3-hydroxybutyryl-CoA epimerase
MKPKYQHFRIDENLQDRVTIWIDVQGKSVNALSEPVFDELIDILDAETENARGLPLVFRSAKRDSFVVGADLRRILSLETDAQVQKFLLYGQIVFDRLDDFDGTTVAVIHGPCLGGGLELALACDFRVAIDASKTQLGMPEAKLGLMPGWGGTQRLIESLGVAEGLPMLLTGESVDARRASELQLVDAIVQESSLEAELTSFLRRLADSTGRLDDTQKKRSEHNLDTLVDEMMQFDLGRFGILSDAQDAIYRATWSGIMQSRDLGLQAERELFYPLLISADVQEKLQTFVNRSKPSS